MRDDIEKAKEVGREIRKGSLRSFSIGGQALEKQKRNNKELGDYNEISKLELHEVTICEKGINPEAKFNILKQDVGNMNNIEKAIQELNILLKKIGLEPGDDLPEEVEDRLEASPKAQFTTGDFSASRNPDPKLGPVIEDEGEYSAGQKQAQEDIISTKRRENLTHDPETGEVVEEEAEFIDDVILSDDTEELKMTEEEVIENEEYMDSSEEELKSEKDLPTGQVERGEQSEVIVEGGKPRPKHDQMDSKMTTGGSPNPTDVGKSTWNGETHGLDLSHENLEKAYQQFKAEQMEKLAYDDIKRSFQSRLNTELSVKKANVQRNEYDAQAEVSELKKQFSDLLDALKNDAEMTIAKQEKFVSDMNIPSYDDIAKMDWNEIHLTMQRLEEQR